ncbi:MAG: RNA methyltransferase [Deltaproteobacteria bacterium]|nr:RNA methyltransferase [Deltaproteobacteria bacterium]
MDVKAKLENVTLVLSRPKYPGNVGSVARCARNFGIDRIMVVGSNSLDPEAMKQMSTHFAADIVEKIIYSKDLDEALSPFRHIVGTTARKGSARGPFLSPRDAAPHLAEMSANNTIAMLFGPEDAGLTNEEIRRCHTVVTIPTADAFRSLNLSHAAMILCYELFVCSAETPQAFTPAQATSRELEGMFGQIKELLLEIGFLNPENPDYWMTHLRRLLFRIRLTSREVKIIRGICRQLSWYLDQKNPDRKNA